LLAIGFGERQQMLERQGIFDRDERPAGARLDHLQQQERIWFAWVCRLHDAHVGNQTPQSAAVLAIAQRRWAEARRALENVEERRRRGDRRADSSPPGPEA
jgi:hypothetical protein